MLKILKLVAIFCGTLAATAVFGQSTYVWTNQNPTQLTTGDLNRGLNWTNIPPLGAGGFDPGGIPRPDFQDGITWGDEMLFDGRTTGPLLVTQNGGVQANGGGSGQPYGLRIHLTANQTSPVTIISPVTVSGGMRMNYFTIDAGSGGLRLGTNGPNVLDIVAGVLNGQIFGFTNNSATPFVVNPDVRWRFGGAGAHPFIFGGTGDWTVNNRLRGVGGTAALVQKFGPGTMTWAATNVGSTFFDLLGTPVTIGGGTMILKTADLVDTSAGIPNIIHNGTLLKYDVQPTPGLPTGPATIAGNISGSGPIQINAGTLTLSGANTFSGSLNLSGGQLILGSAENFGVSGPLGQGGTISLNGGTLAWSAANTFDYSPRFSTAGGQVYSFDTAGQNVTFATGLSSSGGTLSKTNSGTLTLAGASSYSGLTTVSGGKLVFQGSKTGSGDITVANGAALGVTDTGTPVTPNTLTLGTSGSTTLEFNNVNSTTTAPLTAVNLSSAGTVTINVNSGTFPTIGLSYPLLSWTSGSAPAVSLGIVNGAAGTLSTNGNTIQLNVTGTAYTWTGLNNSCWDTITTGNWIQNGSPAVFVPNNGPVLFDDTAAGTTNVTVCAVVQPTGITVNNSTKVYSIASSGGNNIAGGTGLTKSGSGTLTLSGGTNSYTGVTTLSGGTVIVGALANGGSASDIGAANNSAANLVLNGGTLQYTGSAASMDRLFTVGLSGGTIDVEGSGALTLSNPGTITLGGTLTLSGNTADTNILAPALIQSGGLNKSGTGTWILTGTNSFGGGTTISNGVLQVGANGGTGSLGGGNVSIAAGTAIDFRRTGTLTVGGAISGNGSVSQNGSGTVILANNNTYSGGTTINAGTLQIGNGGSTGSLNPVTPIVNDSLVIFNTAGSFIYTGGGLISGTGNVIIRGAGVQRFVGANSYTGWTLIDSGATFQPCQGNTGALASSVVTNNGTLKLVRQDNGIFIYTGPIVGTGRVLRGINGINLSDVTLLGTNTYTGGTYIGAGAIIFGDGSNAGFGSFVGNVIFTNNFDTAVDSPRTLILNRPDNFTFSGTITTNFSNAQSNRGVVQQNGIGTLTLTGNNTYASGTIINAGILQVGAGGASGSLGTGPVTDHAMLVFNRTGTLAVGTVTGTGSMRKLAAGTVTLSGASSVDGDVSLEAGTFGAAPAGSIGSLSVGGNLTIASGVTILAGLNRALSPSNSVYTGSINHTNGGTLSLLNAGPLLQVGDKFTIFSQPVTNMTIVSPGFTVSNDLGVDGSVTVTAVQPPPTITTSVAGNQLTLSWPSLWTGAVHLQAQTNPITSGLGTNWVTIAGTDATNSYSTVINKKNGTVFFRLVSP